jgi:hypothetical protein
MVSPTGHSALPPVNEWINDVSWIYCWLQITDKCQISDHLFFFYGLHFLYCNIIFLTFSILQPHLTTLFIVCFIIAFPWQTFPISICIFLSKSTFWPHVSSLIGNYTANSDFRVYTCHLFSNCPSNCLFLHISVCDSYPSSFLHTGHIPWPIFPLKPFSLHIHIFHHPMPYVSSKL